LWLMGGGPSSRGPPKTIGPHSLGMPPVPPLLLPPLLLPPLLLPPLLLPPLLLPPSPPVPELPPASEPPGPAEVPVVVPVSVEPLPDVSVPALPPAPGLLVASLEVLLVPLAVDVPPAPLVAWFEAPPAEFAEVRAPVLDVGPAVGDEPVVSSSTSLFVEPHAARHVPSHRYA